MSSKLATYNYTSSLALWARAGAYKRRYPKGRSRTYYQECGCHLNNNKILLLPHYFNKRRFAISLDAFKFWSQPKDLDLCNNPVPHQILSRTRALGLSMILGEARGVSIPWIHSSCTCDLIGSDFSGSITWVHCKLLNAHFECAQLNNAHFTGNQQLFQVSENSNTS